MASSLKYWSRKSVFFFYYGWKPCQKTRLDVLIIFHIEWPHQVSSLVGKQSKYWSKKGKTENHVFLKNGWKPSQKMRLDALIIFHIEWQHQVSSLVGKQSKYWSKYFLWFGVLWGSWILEIRARAGGGNILFYIFYSDGPIYNLQSKQNQIKSQLGEIGCGRAPPPEDLRALPLSWLL